MPTTLERDPQSGKGGRPAREFFRVRASMAIRCRKLDAFDLETVRREIRPHGEEDGSPHDARIYAWLERIERKVDLLLAAATGKTRGPEAPVAPQDVVLSGGGVRLQTEEPVEIGDEVLVEMPVPGARTEFIRALARVVAVERPVPPHIPRTAALCFSEIDEQDREAIVRFTRDVERARLNEAALARSGG